MPEQVELAQAHGFPRRATSIYLKVNSGMNRLGFGVDEVRVMYNALRLHRRVGTITLMTHFADADGAERRARPAALVRASWCAASRRRARSPIRRRCSTYQEARAGWVRPGIMLYGCSPFADWSATEIGLAAGDDALVRADRGAEPGGGRARRLRLHLRRRRSR